MVFTQSNEQHSDSAAIKIQTQKIGYCLNINIITAYLNKWWVQWSSFCWQSTICDRQIKSWSSLSQAEIKQIKLLSWCPSNFEADSLANVLIRSAYFWAMEVRHWSERLLHSRNVCSQPLRAANILHSSQSNWRLDLYCFMIFRWFFLILDHCMFVPHWVLLNPLWKPCF